MEANTKTALVIVDMQNDFCKPNGSLAVEGSLEIIPLINRLREMTDKFDYIVMTRDCHAQNHVSFGSNHPGKDLFSLITVPQTGREQVMWPDHCVKGSFGAEFQKDVVVKESDIQILKGQDQWVESYSGFGSELEETGLEKILKEKGVTTVYCCGLAYDYCVGSTAESAAAAGFNTYLITDAAKSVAEASAAGMKERIVSAGVQEITSDQIMSQVDKSIVPQLQILKLFGRNGGWKPFNSMETFQRSLKRAKDEKVEGVHVEVWMTVDQKLVVIHCGPNGETIDNPKNELVYQINLEHIKQHCPDVCLLEDVLKLFEGSEICVNIEVKTPEQDSDYETSEAMQEVIDTIVLLQSTDRALISSFDTNALDENCVEANEKGIEVAYIYNYYEGKQDDDIGVEAYCQTKGQTVILCSTVVSKELCSEIQQNGKKVGVWIPETKNPNQEYFEELEGMGVDQAITSFEIDDTPPKQQSNHEIVAALDNSEAIAQRDEKIKNLEVDNQKQNNQIAYLIQLLKSQAEKAKESEGKFHNQGSQQVRATENLQAQQSQIIQNLEQDKKKQSQQISYLVLLLKNQQEQAQEFEAKYALSSATQNLAPSVSPQQQPNDQGELSELRAQIQESIEDEIKLHVKHQELQKKVFEQNIKLTYFQTLSKCYKKEAEQKQTEISFAVKLLNSAQHKSNQAEKDSKKKSDEISFSLSLLQNQNQEFKDAERSSMKKQDEISYTLQLLQASQNQVKEVEKESKKKSGEISYTLGLLQTSAQNAKGAQNPPEQVKPQAKSTQNPLGGGNDALKVMKEKLELKMKLSLTQKLLDKTMNEYKFLKDETIRKEQLQKELSKKKASQKSSGFKF